MRNFDQEAQDNSGRQYNYASDLLFRELMLEDFSSYMDISSNSKSLEIGSYDGSMTEQILKYTPNLTVVEPSFDLSKAISNRFGSKISVVNSTIEDFSYHENFDNIFLVHTLEHVDSPVEVLQKIMQHLTPTGRLFIAVPNANALSRQIAVHMGLISHNAAVLESESKQGHLRTYSIDTFRRDILASGLLIEHLSGVFLKALANFQLDEAIEHNIIDKKYFDAANSLAKVYPDYSASLIAICSLKFKG
jgi:2-polyprenyl-3-methyl-5-hydroxy-6-metoxy-1,4-benzoquinol methylase